MEIVRCKILVFLIFLISACSNSNEMDTGEIKMFKSFERLFDARKQMGSFIDARDLISREKIDQSKVPILFAELETGQNGTLYKYPDEGLDSTTWIGVDGATITLQNGLLMATRGMGHDLMGSKTSLNITWSDLVNKTFYDRQFSYLVEGNTLSFESFNCSLLKTKSEVEIENFDIKFLTDYFEEVCSNGYLTFKNDYFVDKDDVVRRANVFHSQVIGNIYIERLDR